MLNLEKYEFSKGEYEYFKNEFFELLPNVDLNELEIESFRQQIESYDVGVYFWVLTIKNKHYKIYIGKTNSIKRRIKEYTIGFQIHSPNDFKMRFFQNFIEKHFSKYTLSLFFVSESLERYSQKETESIRYFKPMINEHSNSSAIQKKAMQKAFANYYESVFHAKLNNL
jgi:hypothetical protein